MTQQNDTSPLIRSRRIKRSIQIEERNDPPMPNSFDVKVVYDSDNLPEWFAPLQPIVEDETFTSMVIHLGDGKTQYHLTLSTDLCSQCHKTIDRLHTHTENGVQKKYCSYCYLSQFD